MSQKCSNCGFENPAESKFCQNCGINLDEKKSNNFNKDNNESNISDSSTNRDNIDIQKENNNLENSNDNINFLSSDIVNSMGDFLKNDIINMGYRIQIQNIGGIPTLAYILAFFPAAFTFLMTAGFIGSTLDTTFGPIVGIVLLVAVFIALIVGTILATIFGFIIEKIKQLLKIYPKTYDGFLNIKNERVIITSHDSKFKDLSLSYQGVEKGVITNLKGFYKNNQIHLTSSEGRNIAFSLYKVENNSESIEYPQDTLQSILDRVINLKKQNISVKGYDEYLEKVKKIMGEFDEIYLSDDFEQVFYNIERIPSNVRKDRYNYTFFTYLSFMDKKLLKNFNVKSLEVVADTTSGRRNYRYVIFASDNVDKNMITPFLSGNKFFNVAIYDLTDKQLHFLQSREKYFVKFS